MMKINPSQLHSLLPPTGVSDAQPSANPVEAVPSALVTQLPEGTEPGLLEAFQRLTGALMEVPQALLRPDNEKEIAEFLKQGHFDQQQVLQDLRTVSNTMTRMAPGQEVLLASGQNGAISLSPQKGLLAQGATSGETQKQGGSFHHSRGPLGDASVQTGWQLLLGRQAEGSVQVRPDGLNAQGKAWAGRKSSGELKGQLNTLLGDANFRARGEATGQAYAEGKATLDQNGLKAQGEAGAELKVDGRLNANFQNALVQSNTQIDAGAVIGAKGKGDIQADLSGIQAKGEVGAKAQVGIQAQNQTRSAGVEIGGERLDVNSNVKATAVASAKAGAEVDVAATIAPPRAAVDAEVGAFAGAKAGVEGKIGLGDFVSVKGKAEAWAGAGAQAGIIAGLKDGKLRFGFHAGAAVKAGAGFKWSVEIDVQKIAKAMIGGSLQVAERGLEFALNPLGAAERTVNDVANLLSQKKPGTVSLGSQSSPLPLSQLVMPLLEQSNAQQQATDAVRKAVTDILGPDTSQAKVK